MFHKKSIQNFDFQKDLKVCVEIIINVSYSYANVSQTFESDAIWTHSKDSF